MSVVQTDRLVLRPWKPSDIDDVAAVFAIPEVWRYPFGRGMTREEAERFVERQLGHWADHGFGLWAAELAAGGGLIGFIGLAVPTWLPEVLPAVEVGWRLHPDHWGKGLATEGAQASLRHGFKTLGLERIISIFDPGNVASGRVMEKLGMRDCLTTADPRWGGTLLVREITRAEWAQ